MEPTSAPLRFVILLHSTEGSAHQRPTHWDFMIELADADPQAALRTWALAAPPQPGEAIAATELVRHRSAYLDYEGPIGDDRGSVRCVERGHYRVLEQTAGKLKLLLAGEKIRGVATLRRAAEEAEFVFRLELPA
jgi:hypothetical protein